MYLLNACHVQDTVLGAGVNETDKTPAPADRKASRSYCMPICIALLSKELRNVLTVPHSSSERDYSRYTGQSFQNVEAYW